MPAKMAHDNAGGHVMATWNPTRYLGFADQRSRPFVELVDRVDLTDPRRIVDLGCGPGHLTPVLRSRWPAAAIEGVDSSPEMIARAVADNTDPDVSYAEADLRDWVATAPVDLAVSNAAYQWVPGHLELLPRLADQVAPGGVFAFSVPGNFDEPSHRLLDELAGSEPFAVFTRDRARPDSHDAATYLELLAGLGWTVDAWETTYLHVLSGDDPVFDWISGTGARPALQGLSGDLREDFVRRYKTLLRDAYPTREWGTVLPFRRVFVVARRPA
jgi:trans-aconitate 2-methyltransferase